MTNYSVMVRWEGISPFNDTMDVVPSLSKKECAQVADIYCANKKSSQVDIIHCVDGNRTIKHIKLNGERQ